ncbi:hypothetical protein IG631_07208 [Alternaria alternata]|nr:hypothetical protein IG631_07208 [Alternaria alternata]
MGSLCEFSTRGASSFRAFAGWSSVAAALVGIWSASARAAAASPGAGSKGVSLCASRCTLPDLLDLEDCAVWLFV